MTIHKGEGDHEFNNEGKCWCNPLVLTDEQESELSTETIVEMSKEMLN